MVSIVSAQDGSAQGIRVLINNQHLVMDTSPIIRESRTLVPLRAIFEALGATVEWDASTRTAIGRRSGRTVVLQVDNKAAWVDGRPVAVEVPPTLYGGRIMLPTRFIAESLGQKSAGIDRTELLWRKRSIR